MNNIAIRIAVRLITFYQLTLSLLIGNQCRFFPTCSQYTLEAIETYGLLKGTVMGLRRISHCHPWHAGGHDPVPLPPQSTHSIEQQS